jgi:hypothetical protein
MGSNLGLSSMLLRPTAPTTRTFKAKPRLRPIFFSPRHSSPHGLHPSWLAMAPLTLSVSRLTPTMRTRRSLTTRPPRPRRRLRPSTTLRLTQTSPTILPPTHRSLRLCLRALPILTLPRPPRPRILLATCTPSTTSHSLFPCPSLENPILIPLTRKTTRPATPLHLHRPRILMQHPMARKLHPMPTCHTLRPPRRQMS